MKPKPMSLYPRYRRITMFNSHKILCFCLILLALLGFTAQAQADVEQFVIPVGEVGSRPPDPNSWVIAPSYPDTTTCVLVWEDNKQLQFGPGPLSFFIDGDSGSPYTGHLLDAGLNAIPGTAFFGIVNVDAVAIDLTESTRFSGLRFEPCENLDSPNYIGLWFSSPTVVEGEAGGNQPPIAYAGKGYSVNVGDPATLNGGNSKDPDGSIVQYDWDYGDGNSALDAGPTPTHTWAEVGTYNVTLTVTDNNGATDSDSTTAEVIRDNAPPVADAGGLEEEQGEPYYGTVGVPLQFDGSRSTDDVGIVRYAWDFGLSGGDEGEGVAPQFTYTQSAWYTVTLTVWDEEGAFSTDYATARIGEGNQPPQADAGPPVVGTSGVAVAFDASGSSDPDGTIDTYAWDFGDNSTGTGATPSHTYAAAGDYTVIVTVTDDAGSQDSDTTAATIDSATPISPKADAGGPYSGTAGGAVTFDGSGSSDPDGTIASYAWDFGDGNTGSGVNPSHTYATADNYVVTLTVTDDDGLTNPDTAQATIAVGNQPPTADPNGSYGGVAGTPVTFDGSGSSDPDGTIATYAWDFGDGNTGSGVDPSHTYATADNYVVTLTVTDDDGVSDSETTGAVIAAANQPPTADANGPYTGAVNVAVNFDGSASNDPDGTIASYAWDFGDGNTGSGATPSHPYATADNYTVTLTVTDNDGATSAEAFSTAAIDSPNVPPVADADGPYAGKVGVPVDFDGSASSDPDGTIATYAWDFDDGNTGTGATPSHTYAATGAYNVVLTVTDNDGDSASAATGAIIGDGINLPPTADPGGPYTGEVNVAVSFNGRASSDPDGTIATYAWDFGDGNTGTGARPSHSYAAADNYVVTLTVTDDGGKTDTQTATAVIGAGNQPPTSDAGGPYAGVVNVPVQFDGTGSTDPDGSIVQYAWTFGDGGTSSRLNPTHTYAAPGPYTVTLTVTDDEGETDDATALVIIGDGLQIPPTADADGPYLGVVNAPVTFDGTASDDPDGTINAYDWLFDDGNSGTGPMPDHTYLAGGLYYLTLQVTDDDGFTASDSSTVLIGDLSLPPTADANGPYRARLGVPVTFDGTGSDDPDGDIVRYDWDFGEGTTADDAGPTPSHTYTTNSRYLVTLTVTDESGETDTDITVITVGVGNLAPEADAGDSVNGKVRRDITFDGTGSSDPDGNIVSYAWEFGDGNTGTGPNPTHSYADAGKYLVTLTVTDNDGATSSDVTLADAEKRSGGGGGDGLCFINTVMGQ